MKSNEINKARNYYLVFLGTYNVHLIKDVGMIPFILNKYYNYESFIVTYNNDNYTYLSNEVKGLKLFFLNKSINEILDVIVFLFKNSKNIDVIQFFHPGIKVYIYSLFYRLLNRTGIIYVKLDADDDAIMGITGIKKGFKYKLKRYINNFYVKYIFDFISVETKKNYKKLIDFNRNVYYNKLLYIPNGFYLHGDIDINLSNKKNYILTVGRLGTKQKATEILLEAFARINDLRDWQLILVGPIEEHFSTYVKEYFKKYQNLRDKIIFTGNITDRNKLYKYYSESKIFCLPSRWESFGISMIEAAWFGCYIVATDVGATKDILEVTKYGCIVNKDDPQSLANTLQDLITNWDTYKRESIQINRIVDENFNWMKICSKLDKKIKEIMRGNK